MKNLMMKLIDNTQDIFNQYELKPIKLPAGHKDVYSFLRTYPEFKKDFETEKNDFYFINKYHNYIDNGHYGFSIGTPIVPEWNEIIEKILDLCIKTDPDFKIQQIKLKFGMMCFYVQSNVIEDVQEIEKLIMNKMRDSALVY